MSAATIPLDAKSVAERHEQDVTAILAEMNRAQRLIDQVVELEYDISLRRGDTTRDAKSDFADWAHRVIRSARRRSAFPDAGWSEDLSGVLRRYLEIAATDDMTVGQAMALLADIERTLSKPEQHVADLVAAVLIGSLQMWTEHDGSGDPSAKKSDGIDKSQVARADVMGAITGAAGAAVATWWSGPVSGGAVAGATVTGAVLGSAVDAVLQDAGNDAVDDELPDPVAP
jgi:hypothetical protein